MQDPTLGMIYLHLGCFCLIDLNVLFIFQSSGPDCDLNAGDYNIDLLHICGKFVQYYIFYILIELIVHV